MSKGFKHVLFFARKILLIPLLLRFRASKVLLLKCIIYKFNDHDVLSAFDGLLPTEKEPERAFQSFSNYWQVTFRAERHSGVCFLIQTKTILKGIYFLYWLISLGYD